MQDLRARQQPIEDQKIESNLHPSQHQDSSKFEAPQLIPKLLLTTSSRAIVSDAPTLENTSQNTRACSTAIAALELEDRNSAAERLHTSSGVNNGANIGVNRAMPSVSSQGTRKHGKRKRGAGASHSSSRQKQTSSTSEGTAKNTEGHCIDCMRGDAGEVWVNVFVVGTGEHRKVRAPLPSSCRGLFTYVINSCSGYCRVVLATPLFFFAGIGLAFISQLC